MSTEQLEEVLNALVPFARGQLEKTGSFLPFAGALDRAGEVELLLPSGAEEAETGELLAILVEGLRGGAADGSYLVTGVCLDVTAQREEGSEPIDAICVHLETRDACLAAYVPYARTDAGTFVFGEVFFGAHTPEVFPAA